MGFLCGQEARLEAHVGRTSAHLRAEEEEEEEEGEEKEEVRIDDGELEDEEDGGRGG